MTLRALLATSAGLLASAGAQRPAAEPVRGITISTHGVGREWADETVMGPTLDRIRAAGAEWIAIHPYASIQADGGLRYSARRGRPTRQGSETPEHWHRVIEFAHQRNLKVLIKPHIAYWGSRFSWRGEIRFEHDTEWQRFFAQYRAWIEAMATACRATDGFCVGTELDQTIDHVEEWRGIIGAVRARTNAALTYAANWTDYQRVPFWRDLDAIGIQAYFPLTEIKAPNDDALNAAWAERMRGLRAFADRHHRNIVFTELGYNRSHQTAARPWEYQTDGADAEPLQARCLTAALRAIEAEQAVVGAFLWKWFPGSRPNGRNFQLATPALLGVLREQWPTAAERKPRAGGR